MIASSTKLRLVSEACPHALDHLEAGARGDVEVFATGIAAHAVIDAVHREINKGKPMRDDIARAIGVGVMATLVLRGRTHDGQAQPPIPADHAARGMELALRHLAFTGYDLPVGSHPEIGLAVDRDWRPVPYDDARAMYRGILDLCGVAENEDGHVIASVTDYKTSWRAGPDSPDTLQLRGQVLLLLAHAKDLLGVDPAGIDWIERRVVNLQSGQTHVLATDLNSFAQDELDLWRSEIGVLARGITKSHAPRPANPGPNCGRCPYRRVCDAVDPDARGLEETARRYAVHKAQAKALETVLRVATEEESVYVGEQTLGWHTTQEAAPTREAGSELWHLIVGEPPHPAGLTLLQALQTAGGVRAAVKVACPGPGRREERDELAKQLLSAKTSLRWGFGANEDGPPGEE